jgi:hypothetical protein
MIPIPTGARVWLVTGHTDMRKGFDGLALIVQETLKRDPHSGHLFVFLGRRLVLRRPDTFAERRRRVDLRCRPQANFVRHRGSLLALSRGVESCLDTSRRGRRASRRPNSIQAIALVSQPRPLSRYALGTDGGGSIRIPASCCGIVGLKATLGSIPHLQPPDLFGANSDVGPMARMVAYARLLFEAVAGPDRRDPYGQGETPPPRRLVGGEKLGIGFLLRCGNRLDPAVEAAVVAAMLQAETLGMTVEPIELDLVSMEPHFLVMLRSQLLTRLGAGTKRNPEKLDPTLIATMEAGRAYSATDLWEAQYARTDCFGKIQKILAAFDLIASPTLSAPPLPVGVDPLGRVTIDGRDAGTIRGAWYPYTFSLNLTGHPALSLPWGWTEERLPIVLQLVGRWHDDAFLLDVAERFEAVFVDHVASPVSLKEGFSCGRGI